MPGKNNLGTFGHSLVVNSSFRSHQEYAWCSLHWKITSANRSMKGRIIIKKNQLWFLILYYQWNIWLSASFWLQVNTFLICSSILQTFSCLHESLQSQHTIIITCSKDGRNPLARIIDCGIREGRSAFRTQGKPLKTLLSGWCDTCLSLSTEERVSEERDSIHKQTSESTVFPQERAGNRGGFGWM